MKKKTGKMSRNKGMRFEREIADFFGTQRMGTLGKSDDNHGDVFHHDLFIQCKRRSKLPKVIMDWWHKTNKDAIRAEKTPVVIMREDRGEALVLLRITDWK